MAPQRLDPATPALIDLRRFSPAMVCRFRSSIVTALSAIALSLFVAARGGASEPALLSSDLASARPEAHWDSNVVAYQSPDQFSPPFVGETWIAPPGAPPQFAPQAPPVAAYTDPAWGGQPVVLPCPTDAWYWQALPDGLIYHSYWAGVHEPRLGIVMQRITGGDAFFDGTLGGRVGLLRYGTGNAIFPQGYQLDVEAAAMVRLTLDEIRDFETADYRVGIPLTYGIDNWQFKLAVYHLSSHLGDEFIVANPGATRINYVRDEVVLGASYYPIPECRLYGEIGYAFNVDGGAEPWEIQIGTELAAAGPTGLRGTPFFAVNGHLREEVDWGGDLSTQLGWLWRGNSGQVTRIGLHYFNGKSSQYQTFNQFEEQIGLGLWYDF
jgi:hypothetical protein